MEQVVHSIGVIVGGVAFFALTVLLLFGQQLFVLLALREIRQMAATLPEVDRERWLNESLTSFNSGLKR